MIDVNELWRFDLRKGNSNNPRDGACLLDAVSWFEYGELDDHPKCVCETLAGPGRIINDLLPYDQRQKLKPLIEKMIGTENDGFAQQRGEFWAWQAIRVFAPISLDTIGLSETAAILRTYKGTLEFAADADAARAAAAAAADAARAAAAAAADAARAARADATHYTNKSKIYDAVIDAMYAACEIGKPRPRFTSEKIEYANRTFALAAS